MRRSTRVRAARRRTERRAGAAPPSVGLAARLAALAALSALASTSAKNPPPARGGEYDTGGADRSAGGVAGPTAGGSAVGGSTGGGPTAGGGGGGGGGIMNEVVTFEVERICGSLSSVKEGVERSFLSYYAKEAGYGNIDRNAYVVNLVVFDEAGSCRDGVRSLRKGGGGGGGGGGVGARRELYDYKRSSGRLNVRSTCNRCRRRSRLLLDDDADDSGALDDSDAAVVDPESDRPEGGDDDDADADDDDDDYSDDDDYYSDDSAGPAPLIHRSRLLTSTRPCDDGTCAACTRNFTRGRLDFRYCDDDTKYVQCDPAQAGRCYVRNCAPGTRWNRVRRACWFAADLAEEFRKVGGFSEAVSAKITGTAEVDCSPGTEDCTSQDRTGGACCGMGSCACNTPSSSLCASEGCRVEESFNCRADFCSDLGGCGADPCGAGPGAICPSPPPPSAPTPRVPSPARPAGPTPTGGPGPTPARPAGPTPTGPTGPTPARPAGPTPARPAGPTPTRPGPTPTRPAGPTPTGPQPTGPAPAPTPPAPAPTGPSPSRPSRPCDDGSCRSCAQSVRSGLYYLPYCFDTDKFVQCDDFGVCFVQPCPPGLVWREEILTCS